MDVITSYIERTCLSMGLRRCIVWIPGTISYNLFMFRVGNDCFIDTNKLLVGYFFTSNLM